MTSYKDILTEAMSSLAQDQMIRFVGYNCRYGRAGGTLAGVAEEQCMEMPLSENLMAGACVGLSLEGLFPVLWLERFDFAACCVDALVNHLLKLRELSRGIHCPAAIIRVAVGNSKTPLFTGATHCQDFSDAFEAMGMPVMRLTDKSLIKRCYASAYENLFKRETTMVVEWRDLYGI